MGFGPLGVKGPNFVSVEEKSVRDEVWDFGDVGIEDY